MLIEHCSISVFFFKICNLIFRIVQNGVSFNMLKIGSKRRRPTAEIQNVRIAEDEREANYQKQITIWFS